jgi:hypothetical protein
MRLIALIVITPLLLSSQLSTSHAAAKAGAKCTKVGSKSVVGAKTFTCIKSGTKLIWDKGVRKPTPSATPSIIATPTPSRTGSTPNQLIGSAEQLLSYEIMKRAMQPISVGKLFRYHYSQNAVQSFKDYLEVELNYSMTYWTRVYDGSQLFNVFYGTEKDLDWLIEAWKPYGFDKNKGFAEDLRGRVQREGNRLNAGAVPSQADPSHLSILRHSSLPTEPGSFIPHENVHIVQQQLTKNRTDRMPCWLREGSANLFGNFIVAEKYGIATYNLAKRGDMNNFQWGSSGVDLRKFNEAEWFTHLKSLEGNFSGGCDYLYRFAYGSGLLLSELLMAEGGFDKMMSFWRAFSLETDWRESFKSIYGTTIDDWYREKAIPYLIREYLRVGP